MAEATEAAYFRSMTPSTDGLPTLGRSRRQLGVCEPPSPDPDIIPDEQSRVNPGTGGLSVAPDSVWNLPNHRRPRYLGNGSSGPVADRVYLIHEASLPGSLSLRRDKPLHALIEPALLMPLQEYEGALGSTRPQWRSSTA